MINVSNEYKQYIAGERVFHAKGNIVLADSTILNIDDEGIMSSGVKINDGTSAEGNFTIGSAIINQLTLILDNADDQFSNYDFTDAIIRPQIGLELSATTEWMEKGIFTVDKSVSIGSVITLTALDNMNNLTHHFPTEFKFPTSNYSNRIVEILSTDFKLRQSRVHPMKQQLVK